MAVAAGGIAHGGGIACRQGEAASPRLPSLAEGGNRRRRGFGHRRGPLRYSSRCPRLALASYPPAEAVLPPHPDGGGLVRFPGIAPDRGGREPPVCDPCPPGLGGVPDDAGRPGRGNRQFL